MAEVRNDKGRMPYEYAEMHGKQECLELLMNPDKTLKEYAPRPVRKGRQKVDIEHFLLLCMC